MSLQARSSSDTQSRPISILPLPPARAISSPPAHHVGSPPTSFINPWPSFRRTLPVFTVLRMRLSSKQIPIPSTRDELVPIRKPTWGLGSHGLKMTWIGHASALVETACAIGKSRGVRILLDPVFSERMSPVSFLGPKRFSPPPCSIDELPEVDLVLISHNHYDHLDLHTIQQIYERRRGKVHFFCGLGIKKWFHGIGVRDDDVSELDWWHGVKVDVADVGSVELTCTPAQHASGRSLFDLGEALWCSWVIIESSLETKDGPGSSMDDSWENQKSAGRRFYFAGAFQGKVPQPLDRC